MASIQKITPNLWFNKQAEEAVNYYVSIFSNSRIGRITHYGKEGFEEHHMPDGAVLTIEFWLEDQGFLALNAGPEFKFSEAVSFVVNCKNQEEIDLYWEKLTQGGDEKAQICGWLKDKYGLSWQIVPTALSDMLSHPDKIKTEHVMKALMKMKKIDLAELKDAFAG